MNHHVSQSATPSLAIARGQQTLREILSQPAVWQAALDTVRAKQAELKKFWEAGAFSEVLVSGCGSTYNLSLAVAPLLQQELGVRARAVPASEILCFPEQVISAAERPLLLTLSRSGRTTETIEAARFFKARQQGPTLNIGCYPETELVSESDLALVVAEGQEESVVQTRSFSAMTVTAQAAVAALAYEKRWQAMQTLPALGEQLLATYHELARQLGQNLDIHRFYFLGSGLQYGLACEANLKMKEMSLSVAEAFHFREFRHGPMSMVDEHTLVIGLLSETAREAELAVLREMHALGGKTLALTDQPLPTRDVDEQVCFHSDLPETSRAVLFLPFLQLLGYYRALANGQNPDNPRHLTAVIVLDEEQH